MIYIPNNTNKVLDDRSDYVQSNIIGYSFETFKRHYGKNVDINIKKAMENGRYIFDYKYNVIKCRANYSLYAILVTIVYSILVGILSYNSSMGNQLKFWQVGYIASLALITISIYRFIFRLFLGSVGDIKNNDLDIKGKFRLYKGTIIMLTISYISAIIIQWFILTIDVIFVATCVSSYIIIIIIYISKLGRDLNKRKRNVKQYDTNKIKIATNKERISVNIRETLVQILSNNDIVLINAGVEYPMVISAKKIEYVRIENDKYFIQNEQYVLTENFFCDKFDTREVAITKQHKENRKIIQKKKLKRKRYSRRSM